MLLNFRKNGREKTEKRGARSGEDTPETPIGAGVWPALPEVEGESHGQKARANRAYRRLPTDTAAN